MSPAVPGPEARVHPLWEPLGLVPTGIGLARSNAPACTLSSDLGSWPDVTKLPLPRDGRNGIQYGWPWWHWALGPGSVPPELRTRAQVKAEPPVPSTGPSWGGEE